MTRHMKLACSASGTAPSVRPDSGQTPTQPPPATRRRVLKFATQTDSPTYVVDDFEERVIDDAGDQVLPS